MNQFPCYATIQLNQYLNQLDAYDARESAMVARQEELLERLRPALDLISATLPEADLDPLQEILDRLTWARAEKETS